jgi:hypothetical protein
MTKIKNLWQLLISATLFYSMGYTSNEGMVSKREMHGGETHVKVLTADTIDDFLARDRPVLISFTKDTCHSCVNTDYQLIILADNYHKKKTPIDVATICIKDHGKVAHRYHVHEIPDVRLYYKGLHRRYQFGDDFSLMNKWIEGHIHMKDLINVSNVDKFWKKMHRRRHALIWYGDDFAKLDHRHQELMRRLYFRFSHDFVFFASDSKQIGETFDLERHNLYEWNRYDEKFRRVPTEHLFHETEFSPKTFKKVENFIKINSYRKLEKWNPHWIRTHRHSRSLIFVVKNGHKMTDLELKNMKIFN